MLLLMFCMFMLAMESVLLHVGSVGTLVAGSVDSAVGGGRLVGVF